VPEPFVSGFYDGEKFVSIWDDKGRCIERTMEMLEREEPSIIYAHNGGRFDWFFFLDHLNHGESIRIVNGRIIQAHLGKHEIRDSYAIMPFALDKYRKLEIEYEKFNRGARGKHRAEIISYLREDCVALHELVTAYIQDFGNVLTIGSAAIRELKQFHPFKRGGAEYDTEFRERYYYGGRVEVLGGRVVNHPVEVYDVNSMYPHVMATRKHPIGCAYSVSNRLEEDTCFVTADGWSDGAFPVRTKTGIDFPRGWTYGTYHCTIHEWEAALETKSFRVKRLLKTYGWRERSTFDSFVNHFYKARVDAQRAGDKIHKLFFKYLLNSSYGKFAQNPANYKEYRITGIDKLDAPWTLSALAADGPPRPYMLWEKPCERPVYYNIATAASITGAARAVLLRGLHHVTEPCYCDTDSIIARASGRLTISPEALGGWKVEARAGRAVFAGKKLYALFDAETCVKKACKGARLQGKEIEKIALGEIVTWQSPAPHFALSGACDFVERRIRATV
jgi:DNA polymerase elongation subunit (family B)